MIYWERMALKGKPLLTIAVGVATAAVAISLQEVIASVAGWPEISFGRFYQVDYRVEVSGIFGDIIDI